MHFRFPLLAGLILVLSVDALPWTRTNSRSGIVILPLKHVEQRSDIHPLIAHQQNINRSQRRYARMTGRAEPTVEELTENLRRRMLSIEQAESLAKRYNRGGVPTRTPKARAAGSGAVIAAAAARAEQDTKGRHPKVAADGAAIANGVAKDDDDDTGGNGTDIDNGNGGNDGTLGDNGNTGNNGTSAQGVTLANPPTANNSLGLNIIANDIGYIATVQMGTPPQDLAILMDSGSADFWVGGENCQSEQGGGCGNHIFLGAQGSSSFQDSNQPFQVKYGTGQVSGTIVKDDIVVAGLSLKAHTFGVATVESVEFSANSVPFDGLMGLAQSSLSNQGTLTPIEALATAGLVASAITSYKIPRLADNKNDGTITFGGLDDTKFDAQTLVTLDNVSKVGFWEAAVDATTVDGTDLNLAGRTAILDTGTTLIIMPQADADAIHQNIQGAQSDGQGGFTVPCNTQASVAMTFGGTVFAIDPRDIAFQPLDPNNPNGDCISGIAAGNIGAATQWLVGDVFLKNAYFSTDVNKNNMQLAKLV